MDHPRTELIPYLRGELPPVERESVETHLAGCRACRAERDAFAELLLDLRRSIPETPPLDWARWHADLRARLRRRARRPWLAPRPEMVVAEALMLMEPVEALAAGLPEDIDLIVQLDRLAGGDG